MNNEYKLALGAWNSVFAVPSAVVDNYIKLASGSSIKVLLYFLRFSGTDVKVEDISVALGTTNDEVQDALMFWKEIGLLELSGTEFSPAIVKSIPKKADKVTEEEKHRMEIGLRKIELEREPRFTPSEISKTVRGDEKASILFKQCEGLFGRPLKHNEQNTLMIILEDVGLPVECTMMLVDYCFSIGKPTPAYLKSVAVDWLERDINTLGKCEREIIRLRELRSTEEEIKRLFELTSTLSKVQKNLIDKWVNTYHYDTEMIEHAYQLTLDGTGKLSWQYMDKIISNWNEKNIRNKKQLEEDKPVKKQKDEVKTVSYDLDAYSKLANEKYK